MRPTSAPARDTPSGNEAVESPAQEASRSKEGRDSLAAIAALEPYVLLTPVGGTERTEVSRAAMEHLLHASQDPSEILSALLVRAETWPRSSLQREAQDELDDFEQ